jgi:subtilisin family serine protease
VRGIRFVAWTGALKPAYKIQTSSDAETDHLFIGVYPSIEAASVRAAVRSAGGRILEAGIQPATYGGEFATLKAQAVAMETVATIPHVRWVEAVPRMEPMGEREAQIVARNLDGTAAPNTAPVTGYQAWLTGVGLNANGVTVAIVDSGVDANANNNNPVAHTDLRGRQAAFVDYSGGLGATDTHGHGTNVAGIALGSAATGQTEAAAPGNFLWGQGVASTDRTDAHSGFGHQPRAGHEQQLGRQQQWRQRVRCEFARDRPRRSRPQFRYRDARTSRDSVRGGQ